MRCDDALKALLVRHLGGFERLGADPGVHRVAAVAVAVAEEGDGAPTSTAFRRRSAGARRRP
jgi:hypothetical protein